MTNFSIVRIDKKRAVHLQVKPAAWLLERIKTDTKSNDIGGLLAEYPGIRLILLNGGEAWRLFQKIDPAAWAGRRAVRMPSTSPAYTLSYEKKAAAWRDALAGFIDREE